jgi:hypothetical protein
VSLKHARVRNEFIAETDTEQSSLMTRRQQGLERALARLQGTEKSQLLGEELNTSRKGSGVWEY